MGYTTTRSRRRARARPLARAALVYARELHAGQSRPVDRSPFFEHPREVATLLRAVGAPDHLVAAGALHDVLEKTAATTSDLRSRFGDRVTALVLAVTEDRRIPDYDRRKTALRRSVASAGDEALLLFAADKLSKARELRRGGPIRAGVKPSNSGRREQRATVHYRLCLSVLKTYLPGSPLVVALENELGRVSPAAHKRHAARPSNARGPRAVVAVGRGRAAVPTRARDTGGSENGHRRSSRLKRDGAAGA